MDTNYPNSTLINSGLSGINSRQLKCHLSELIDAEDDIIILMIGTNDRKEPNGMQHLADNLGSMIESIREMGKLIILMSANPVTVQDDHYPNRLYSQREVNEVIKLIANQKKVCLINHYEWIKKELLLIEKTLEDVLLASGGDGLHPTDDVHEMMFDRVIQSLDI